MKGRDIIRIIRERNLEDFELEFVFSELNDMGINVRTFSIDDICDIGYSSNEVSFDGEEK